MPGTPGTPGTPATPQLPQQGWDASVTTDAERRTAIEAAFNYRGDVTVEARDGRTLVGYVFDRRPDGPEPTLRMLLVDGGRGAVPYADLARLTFTGRDPAAGMSWETWVRKYAERKAANQENSKTENLTGT